jgi:hypothetical protein
MNDVTLLWVTDKGKRELERGITQMRQQQNLTMGRVYRMGSKKTCLDISKDTLYRTGVGSYRQSASLIAVIAYAKLGMLGYLKLLDSEMNLAFEYISGVLLGKIKAYGKPVITGQSVYSSNKNI